jgi:excinuclease ABC subunit A
VRSADSGSSAESQALRTDKTESSLITFSQRYACVDHPDEVIPELEPRLFSFNAPFGACPTCTGLGSRLEVDPDLALNPNLTIREGAIRPFNRINIESWYMKKLDAVAERHHFSLREPVKNLSEEAKISCCMVRATKNTRSGSAAGAIL